MRVAFSYAVRYFNGESFDKEIILKVNTSPASSLVRARRHIRKVELKNMEALSGYSDNVRSKYVLKVVIITTREVFKGDEWDGLERGLAEI